MKRARIVVALLIVLALFFSWATYILLPDVIRLTISSIIDVPICNSHIANKLGVQANEVRDHILKSLKPGMTANEVEETLSKVAPISILETYIVDANQSTYVSIKIKLCYNPLGDMVLDTYFSKDGKLIRVEDAWADN